MKKVLFVLLSFFLFISCNENVKDSKNISKVLFNKDSENMKIDVFLNGKFFTSYIYNKEYPKPFLFPVKAKSGLTVTRGFPLNPIPGERTDHPHQIGHWFNYGNVNGLDFWNNSGAIPKKDMHLYGKIVQTKILELNNKKGYLLSTSQWQSNLGEHILTEKTKFIFSELGSTRIIDRITELEAVKDVSFKDNKEGLFAIRVIRQMELPSKKAGRFIDSNGLVTDVKVLDNTGVNGDYLSSEGLKGRDVWGTRARWVKLYSKVNDKNISITIMDSPKNIGHPSYWHARDYGLFSANNLGQSAFSQGREVLNFSLKSGEKIKFKHRMLINSGDELSTEHIENFYNEFSENKTVKLFKGKNLNKWDLPKNNLWWSINEDGILVAKNDPKQIGSNLFTKKKYSNFYLELDFKFISGKIDSGVFIRGNQSEINPQIQIGESGSLKRDMTGSPYIPKNGYPVEANEVSKNLKLDGWNKMGIKVVDNNYVINLNGVQILDYNHEYSNLPGPIGLQIHKSRDMEIWFKNINISEI